MAKAPLPFNQGGNPPWHMWGSTQILEASSTPAFGGITSRQLAKIQYKRPETWSFFFGARILAATVPAGVTLGIHVAFDLIIGVGRTMFDTTAGGLAIGSTIPAFAKFRFTTTVPLVPVLNQPKWRTTGESAVFDDSTPLVLPPPIEWFPAQDIQCSARVQLQSVGTAKVEVTSWFAPRSHVRPDWFRELDAAQFRGAETDGT